MMMIPPLVTRSLVEPVAIEPVTRVADPATASAGPGAGQELGGFVANPPERVAEPTAAEGPLTITGSAELSQGTQARAVIDRGNRPGDQILSGLEKLSRSVQDLDSPSLFSEHFPDKSVTTSAGTKVTAAMSKGGKTADADPVAEMRDLVDMAMRQQERDYVAIYDFELIANPTQAMLGSLKTLLKGQ